MITYSLSIQFLDSSALSGCGVPIINNFLISLVLDAAKLAEHGASFWETKFPFAFYGFQSFSFSFFQLPHLPLPSPNFSFIISLPSD